MLRQRYGLLLACLFVLFVVLGNPSAGGAFPTNLLPSFFSAIGPWLPPGAATSAIRGIVYFDNAGVGNPVLVMVAWLVVGLVLLVVPTMREQSRQRARIEPGRPGYAQS